MIIKIKPLIIVFTVVIIGYLIVDLFFNDLFLYLVGGALGSLLKVIGLQKSLFIVWLITLVSVIFLYKKINIYILKWLLLTLISFLLYLVDFLLYKVLLNITSVTTNDLHIIFSVLIKSSLLTWVYYSGNKTKVSPTRRSL